MKTYLVTFKDKVDLGLLKSFDAKNIIQLKHINQIAICDLNEKNAEDLFSDKKIYSVEQDKSDKLDATTALLANETYVYSMMNVGAFHDRGIKGQGIKVAVIDSGVQKHTAYTLSGGYNAYDESLPYDKDLTQHHGTRVAGIIAMRDGGIAPEVELYAVRTDSGDGDINRTDWSTQIKAINWCIDNNMDAINCSFSSEDDSIARKLAFKAAYEAGIAIFCSAGNRQSGKDAHEYTIGFPSKYPFVITVGNIQEDKTLYERSSTGIGIDFVSGGTLIRSTTTSQTSEISSNFGTGSGTSYATPAVLGMYCLYKQMYDEPRDKILQRMVENTEKLGHKNLFGRGIPKYPSNNYENITIRG